MNCLACKCHSHASAYLHTRRPTPFIRRDTGPEAKEYYSLLPHGRPLRSCRRSARLKRECTQRCKASDSGRPHEGSKFDQMDSNQLQTALNNAIKSENYALAALLRNKLNDEQGADANFTLDWRSFGCPDWLAERAEQMGFSFPTGMCSQAEDRGCRCGLLPFQEQVLSCYIALL